MTRWIFVYNFIQHSWALIKPVCVGSMLKLSNLFMKPFCHLEIKRICICFHCCLFLFAGIENIPLRIIEEIERMQQYWNLWNTYQMMEKHQQVPVLVECCYSSMSRDHLMLQTHPLKQFKHYLFEKKHEWYIIYNNDRIWIQKQNSNR